MKDWWHEIAGYSAGLFAWIYKFLPGTCEGWTKVFALLTVTVTFIFITLPKAWDFQKKRWTNGK